MNKCGQNCVHRHRTDTSELDAQIQTYLFVHSDKHRNLEAQGVDVLLQVLQERDTDVMRDFAAVGDTGPESARTHGHTHDVQDDGDNQIQTSSPKHDES